MPSGNRLSPYILLFVVASWLAAGSAGAEKIPAASGMAPIDDNSFLVVHDKKGHKSSGGRVGVIETAPGQNVSYVKMKVDWSPVSDDEEQKANDLESVCALPGKPHEFLTAESGYRKDEFGRIFHLRLNRNDSKGSVSVIGKIMLPADTVNIEGMACLALEDGKFMIVLGERGRHNAADENQNHNGKLRWGTLDLASGKLILEGDRDVLVESVQWSNPANRRDISDLYVDEIGVLWGAAAEDPGNAGPFRSVLYRIGPSMDVLKEGKPVAVKVIKQFDGLKVEALSEAPEERGTFSIMTDDEDYGGIWRPVF